MRRSAKVQLWWLGLVVALIAVAIALFQLPRRGGQDPDVGSGGDGAGAPATADIQTAIQAVAAAEDGKFDQALSLWQILLKAKPDDPDLLLNQAVTGVKWIGETNSKLTSVTDDQEREQLRKELDAAIAKASATIEQLSKLPGSDGRNAFLQATFLEIKSRYVAPPDDETLMNDAVKVLVEGLKKDPAQPLLACKLDDLLESMKSRSETPAEWKSLAADSMFASWKVEPRNLYLFTRAALALLENKDSRLKEVLQASLETAKPFKSIVATMLRRTTPEELIGKVNAAVDAGDWRQVQQVRQWLNVQMASGTGFKEDVRLVKPDIMALLDVRFLDALNKPPVGTDTSVTQVEYASKVVAQNSGVSICYDADIDLDMDLVVAEGRHLQWLLTDTARGIAGLQGNTLDVPFDVRGMIAVDLFEVDNPSRPRLATVAQKMEDTPQVAETTEKALTPEEIAKANRHDTFQELIIWGDSAIAVVTTVENQPGQLAFQVIYKVPGLSELAGVVQVEPADIDSDGDLDLVVLGKSQVHILQNNGNRSFVDISEFSQLPPAAFGASRLFACDVDRDLDQDLLVAGADAGIHILENILHSQFRFRKMESEVFLSARAASDVLCVDLDGNGSWDPCVVNAQGVDILSTRTPAVGQWVGGRKMTSQLAGQRLQLADLNNDGRLDLVVGNGTGLVVAWGLANGQWSEPPQSIVSGNVLEFQVIDADNNGALDVVVQTNQQVVVCQPQNSKLGGYLNARVRGINDVNGGGRINHYTRGTTLELRSESQMQSRLVREPASHFGLGNQQPLNLRVIFNNGLTQNVEKLSVNTLVEEKQELKGSCPFVYGWNGERFELITDLLWNAPLGLQIAPGKTLPDRRWEHLLLPGELMQPKQGHYEIQITEELWEVAYFDHIALTAIDHPADVDVFTNEKVGPAEIAQPKLFTVREKRFPKSAIDSYGRDVRNQLLHVDRNFAKAFEHQICQGFCEPHFVELDFGPLATDTPLQLVLNGWMHPTDTSLNIGLAQNPDLTGPEPPSLWVVDEQGKWVCAKPFMGFPGGKPKTIVIDLKDVFQSEDHRLRVGSSQQIYWDQAFVTHEDDSVEVRQIPLPLATAELHYRGFGRLLPRTQDQPHWYDYHDVDRRPKWLELDGPFTRFGDVRELLFKDDDRLVVMVSGDEFTARFVMPEESLPAGWRRDFVLHSIGWDKDADLNTLEGTGSLPLPFKAMESYPPPASQYQAVDDVRRLNQDQLTRLRQRR